MTAAVDTPPQQAVSNISEHINNTDLNLWNQLLSSHRAQHSGTLTNNTMIVCGEYNNGIHQLIDKLDGAHHKNNVLSHVDVLSYNYIQLNKLTNDNTNEYNHKCNIYYVTEVQHSATLIPTVINANDLMNTVYLLCIDMSQPWNIPNILTKWCDTIKTTQTNLFNTLSTEQQQQHKLNNSKRIQSYHSTAIDPLQPQYNIGCSLCILGTRTDQLAGTLAGTSDADTKFDYLIRYIRQEALKYGATIILTSIDGHSNNMKQSVNIDVLHEYLYSTVVNPSYQLTHQPVVVGNDTSYNIYIPCGMDSIELIDSTYTGEQSWFESAEWCNVFHNPYDTQKHKRVQSILLQQQSTLEYQPLDNDTLYKNIKYQLDNMISGTTTNNITSHRHSTSNSVRNSLNATPASPTQSQSLSTTDKLSHSPTTIANNSLITPLSPSVINGKRTTMDTKDKAAAKSFFQNLLSNKSQNNKTNDSKSDKVREQAESTVKKITEQK